MKKVLISTGVVIVFLSFVSSLYWDLPVDIPWRSDQTETPAATPVVTPAATPQVPTPTPAPTQQVLKVGGMDAKRYTNEEDGYTLLYPDTWVVGEISYGTLQINSKTSILGVSVTSYWATDEPLSSFVTQQRRIYGEDMQYEILQRGDVIQLDSTEACVDLISSGEVLKSHGIITFEEHLYIKEKPYGMVFKVIVMCEVLDVDRNKELMDDIITSFDLVN